MYLQLCPATPLTCAPCPLLHLWQNSCPKYTNFEQTDLQQVRKFTPREAPNDLL